MTIPRTLLVSLSASFVSLVLAHPSHASCITQQQAENEIAHDVAILPASDNIGPATTALPTPFIGGFVWHHQFGDYYLDACHVYAGTSNHIGGAVLGTIKNEYNRLGDQVSPLQLPTTSEAETSTHDGRVNYFEVDTFGGGHDGAIYESPASNTHEMQGIIFQQYVAYGETASPLGYPIQDEGSCTLNVCGPNARQNWMQNGMMEFSTSAGEPAEMEAWGLLETEASGAAEGVTLIGLGDIDPLDDSTGRVQVVLDAEPIGDVTVSFNARDGRRRLLSAHVELFGQTLSVETPPLTAGDCMFDQQGIGLCTIEVQDANGTHLYSTRVPGHS